MASKMPRHDMPRQDALARGNNFQVALGYPLEVAVQEANRCLQCKKRKCVAGCPVGVDIPKFIQK